MKKFAIYLTLCLSAAYQLNAQIITTIAGTGIASTTGNGGQATAATLNEPSGVYRTMNGNIYVVEYGGNVVRKIDVSGNISTFAGTGTPGYSGDHGPATAATFHIPIDITFDEIGNAYVVDNVNSVIRKIDTFGIITTFAGNGLNGYSGDNGPATNARLYWPDRVNHDAFGNIYIADAQNNVVRKVDTAGIITTVAGNGIAGFSGDHGPATAASLNWTLGVAFDGNNNMYIADGNNHRVRMVDPNGIITTFAGNGTNGLSGDGGPATEASFMLPGGVAIDGGCNVYITDFYGNNVRKIFTSGIIETVVDSSSTPGFSGDHGNSKAAEINGPDNLTFDTSYSIYFADFYNNRIRKVEKIGANHGCPPPLTVYRELDKINRITISPSPAHNSVMIQWSNNAETKITVRNVMGQIIRTEKTIGTSFNYDVLSLSAGLYLVHLVQNGYEVFGKFVKD